MEALSLLIKPASGNCNMRCRYCFYADVTTRRKISNAGLMTPDTLELIVKKAMDEAERFVSFGFQGGEPTLSGLDFFELFIELEKKYNTKHLAVRNTIQTNGMLIDAKWANFLAKNNFLTGLSVDGCKEVHDALRPDAQGKSTYTRCLKAAAILEKAGAEFNILSVITKGFASHPDKAYAFYKKNGLRYIQLIPCLDGLGEEPGSNPYSLDGRLYGRFLCRLFDLWHADFIKGDYYSVRMFDNYIRMLMGHPPENCGMAGKCVSYSVIEADGSVYPCDFYVLDEYKLGSVQENNFADMLSSAVSERFIKPSQEAHKNCAVCEYHFICRGGCRRDREPLTDGKLSLNRYCEGYKMFFSHALPKMRQIAGTLS